MGSPPGGIGARSATNHAGIAAMESKVVSVSAAGVTQVVVPTQSAQKIKVLSYSLTPSSDAADFQWATSGSTTTLLTGIMGGDAGIPMTVPLNVPFGHFTTKVNESLSVSSVGGIQGHVVYQRVY